MASSPTGTGTELEIAAKRMMSLTEESISDWFQGVLQHLDDIHAGKVKKH
jgi:hypothetical protein